MLRIVKILSIASMGVAALTVVMMLVQIFRGGEGSEFLSLPGAVELFEKKAGNIKPTAETESPLVKQAKLLALAFNPPPPAAPVKDTTVASNTKPTGPTQPSLDRTPPPNLTAKFRLIATACCETVPEKSLALLEMTSAGPTPTTKWVAIGESVEGFTVNQISEKEVTLYQGNTPSSTVEMVQTPTIFPSILKGDPAAGQPVAAVPTLNSPDNPNPVVLPPNMTARDLPKLLEKHTMEEIQAAAAAAGKPPMVPSATGAISTGTGNPARPATETPGATTDPRAAPRRGTYRPAVPPTRTIPNAPVKTPAPPPTPESQKAELDKNIEDIRKLMTTPNSGTGVGNSAEDQKAWGELLKLLEDERKNIDTGGAAPTTPATPTPTPPAPQPETPAPAEPAPTSPPASAAPAPATPPAPGDTPPTNPPAGENPPANTDNSGN